MKRYNCLVIDDEPLARKGIKEFVNRDERLHFIAEGKNVEEALNHLRDEDIDILFLDIQMPGKTGIDMLEALGQRPSVIMTTAYPQYAIKGFDLDVQDYLLKPIAFNRFQQGVSKAIQHHEFKHQKHVVSRESGSFFLMCEGRLVKLQMDEVLYIQGLQNYIQCFTRDKRYISHITMKSLEEKLPEDQFVRIHKSFLINKDNIEKIEGNEVELGGKKLPISRNFKVNAYKKILKDQLISR